MATTLVRPAVTAPALHRWTVAEFDRLPDDLFGGERVELIDGQLYTKTPQGLSHITALRYAFAALQAAYGEGFTVSMQVPIATDDSTRPEPDLTVLRGSPEQYDMRYPDPKTEIALIVKVSDSSLALDLGPKLAMYARSGVPDYWILDLTSRALQVCRVPEGDAYVETAVFREVDRVPVNGTEIEVASLLPRA